MTQWMMMVQADVSKNIVIILHRLLLVSLGQTLAYVGACLMLHHVRHEPRMQQRMDPLDICEPAGMVWIGCIFFPLVSGLVQG